MRVDTAEEPLHRIEVYLTASEAAQFLKEIHNPNFPQQEPSQSSKPLLAALYRVANSVTKQMES